MLTANSPEPAEPPHFSVPIIARLTVHVPVAGSGKKKFMKKDLRTKEFTHTFCAAKANYIELLNMVLAKHHINDKFQVSECRRYCCKIQVPPAK